MKKPPVPAGLVPDPSSLFSGSDAAIVAALWHAYATQRELAGILRAQVEALERHLETYEGRPVPPEPAPLPRVMN
jgi:hypothetical protein